MHSQTLVILLNKRVPRDKKSDILSTFTGKKAEQKYIKGQIADEKREREKKERDGENERRNRALGLYFNKVMVCVFYLC